jgi:hypothetical protein
MKHKQLSLFDALDTAVFAPSPSVLDAVEVLATTGGIEARGAIFTRPEVVGFILDLMGFKVERPLHKFRILEPSFGEGDFLIPILDRLLDSIKRQGIEPTFANLCGCVRAVELHRPTYLATRRKIFERLRSRVSESIAEQLVDAWLVQGDFLLEAFGMDFDFVAGNPPYVRQELIPAPLLAEYKARYATLYDRADLYIPFIERSLSLLNASGILGFICSDRWMKNRYGEPLRSFVSAHYHLAVYVDMVGTDAFTEEVSAYPAITVFNRTSSRPTAIVHRPKISKDAFAEIASAIERDDPGNGRKLFKPAVVQRKGSEPWILESSEQIDLLRRIESDFPAIEEANCRIGIGVATGADKCFIGPFDSLDVEEDRKLPLATTKDIVSGEVRWRGLGVINPFSRDGGLVDLDCYPRLKAYLEARKEAITGRHCAQKAPERWYRTIDRIWPELANRPKLLIPDIKGEAHIVYESGELYPHHNLYFITSDHWDLRALQAVLLSSLTRLFISTYSTQMRGGYLRFQAQYLRRLRLPHWDSVDESLRVQLIEAAQNRELEACNVAVFTLFNLTPNERSALGRYRK